MKVKEKQVYCATFPENGGSVSAVFEDGSSMVLASMNGSGQASVFAITEEFEVTEGVHIDPFVDGSVAVLGGASGEEIVVDQVFNALSHNAQSGVAVQDGLDRRLGGFRWGTDGAGNNIFVFPDNSYVDGEFRSRSGIWTNRLTVDGFASVVGSLTYLGSNVVTEAALDARKSFVLHSDEYADEVGYLFENANNSKIGFFYRHNETVQFKALVNPATITFRWNETFFNKNAIFDEGFTANGAVSITGTATYKGSELVNLTALDERFGDATVDENGKLSGLKQITFKSTALGDVVGIAFNGNNGIFFNSGDAFYILSNNVRTLTFGASYVSCLREFRLSAGLTCSGSASFTGTMTYKGSEVVNENRLSEALSNVGGGSGRVIDAGALTESGVLPTSQLDISTLQDNDIVYVDASAVKNVEMCRDLFGQTVPTKPFGTKVRFVVKCGNCENYKLSSGIDFGLSSRVGLSTCESDYQFVLNHPIVTLDAQWIYNFDSGETIGNTNKICILPTGYSN